MDLPEKLETRNFVMGADELRQTLKITLQVSIGNFLQSERIGSYLDVHQTDIDLVEEQIRLTVEQISGVSIESLVMDEEDFMIVIVYQGNLYDFKFEYKDLGYE